MGSRYRRWAEREIFGGMVRCHGAVDEICMEEDSGDGEFEEITWR